MSETDAPITRLEVCEGSITSAFLLNAAGTLRIAELGTWLHDERDPDHHTGDDGEGWVHDDDYDEYPEFTDRTEWTDAVRHLAVKMLAAEVVAR